jgi:hypothetical protein
MVLSLCDTSWLLLLYAFAQVQQGLAKVPWPVELLQHQQQKDLAAAAPTIQQLLGHEPSAAITATDLLATPAMEAEADAPSVSLLNGSPSSSPIQSFCGGRLASGLVEGLLPDGRAASFDAAGSAAATAAAPSSAGGESAGQTTLLDLLLQRSNSSKLWNRQQQQQQGPNGSIPVTQNARVSSTLTAQTTAAAAAAGSQGVRMQRDSSQDTAPGSPVTSADGNTAWNSRDSGSFLRPIPSGSAAAIGADEGGRPVSLSPLLLQQQQQQQWLAPASVLVPGLRVRMGVASGALGDQEDCMNSKVLETARGEGGGGWCSEQQDVSVGCGTRQSRVELSRCHVLTLTMNSADCKQPRHRECPVAAVVSNSAALRESRTCCCLCACLLHMCVQSCLMQVVAARCCWTV